MIKKIIIVFVFMYLSVLSFGQSHHGRPHRPVDPRYSVFGPPQPDVWEFQLGSWNFDDVTGYSFNFYKINQRNKTIFFRVMDTTESNSDNTRIKQLAGGLAIFPIKNDDRFQVDIGGIYDYAGDRSSINKSLYSRITYRPKKSIWLRVGYEYAGEQITANGADYKTNDTSVYFAGRYDIGKFSALGVLGTGKINEISHTRYGAGAVIKGPFNTFFLGGKIISDDEKEDTRTLAVGRWAPFRPDGLPSGLFIWKHRQDYDFQLGGIFWGKTNSFVRPAALGMTQGIFVSSMGLVENSILRQKQLMTITNDYQNSDFSIFYVYMKKGIVIMPGTVNYVGFRVIQLFRIFKELKYSIFSRPVVGIFYNEQTEPEFNPVARSFNDLETKSWAFQIGVTLFDKFVLNIIDDPHRNKFTISFSFLYK